MTGRSHVLALVLLVSGLGAAGVTAAALSLDSLEIAETGPPPVLADVPAFELTAHTGRPFGSEELRGRIWIANFIFTRCPTVCPALSRRMAQLQARTEVLPEVHLVSFSVDPEFDTPPVLAALAGRLGAGPRWTFLTGSFAEVRAAVEEGLRVAVGRREAGPVIDPTQVFHGAHFVLVDRRGRIRGYHDVSDDEGIERLLAATRRLTADDGRRRPR